jgi:tetratricopeptide (TPR) repeat protein
MTLSLKRLILPFPLLLLAALAAVAASLAGGGGTPAVPPAAAPAASLPFQSTPPGSLSTLQLVQRYTAELRAAPNSAQAYDNLALAELQLAREDGDPTWYTKAGGLLARAVRIAPRDFEAIGAQGSLALSRHDFRDALTLGREALSIDPESSYALGVVVDAEMELGRYGAARATLERMLALRPDLSSYSRASYYLELHGDIGRARIALRRAIESGAPARENTAWAYLYLGNLEFNHGRYALAERQYRLAAHAYPGFVHAQAAQARLAAARGDYGRAIALYNRAVQRIPLPAYVIALGDTYAAAGKPAQAARQYRLVRAEEQLYIANGVNVDVELALFEADHGGDPAQALARAQAAARVQDSVVVDDALAWTQFKAGHLRAALTAANRALRLGTPDASILYHRGAIEAALGMRDVARRDLVRALSVNPHFSLIYVPQAHRLLKEVSP